MSRYDLSPAQWRMLERFGSGTSTGFSVPPYYELNRTELKTAKKLCALMLVGCLEERIQLSAHRLYITHAGRVALRLKEKLDELEAGR